ncbi:hypothetical protein FA15DRAFT_356170 [Coprinopsis marcescibilis]|uniref:Uncharacterized protein n=1 Tax=Coprinopsis marcescibilis TaxID=230819 RepID=A0A5C3KAS0_COPMA|nr:hypothetical protein FA15DRAFT_356170 [Coprinopsis marcescibilis]
MRMKWHSSLRSRYRDIDKHLWFGFPYQRANFSRPCQVFLLSNRSPTSWHWTAGHIDTVSEAWTNIRQTYSSVGNPRISTDSSGKHPNPALSKVKFRLTSSQNDRRAWSEPWSCTPYSRDHPRFSMLLNDQDVSSPRNTTSNLVCHTVTDRND